LDVCADTVLAVVIDRAQPEAGFAVAPAAFHRDELLVGGGQVLGGQGEVGGAQQPLAVVVGFPLRGGAVDAQQPAGVRRRWREARLGLQGVD
jgi:hypothetical protein